MVPFHTKNNKFRKIQRSDEDPTTRPEKFRVVPDTDLVNYPVTGYPANNIAGYRISGEIVNIEFFFNFFLLIFQLKIINISGRYFTLLYYVKRF